MIQGNRESKLNECLQMIPEENIAPRIRLKNKKLPEKTKFTLQYDSYINNNKHSTKHTDVKKLSNYSRKVEAKVQRNAISHGFSRDAHEVIGNSRNENMPVVKGSEAVEKKITGDREIKADSTSLPFLTHSIKATNSEIIDKALIAEKPKKKRILNRAVLNTEAFNSNIEPSEKIDKRSHTNKRSKIEVINSATKATLKKSSTCPPVTKFSDKNTSNDKISGLLPGKSCKGHKPFQNVISDSLKNSNLTSLTRVKNTHSCEEERIKSGLSTTISQYTDLQKRKCTEDCIRGKNLRYMSVGEENTNLVEKPPSKVCNKIKKSWEDRKIKECVLSSGHVKKLQSQENQRKSNTAECSKRNEVGNLIPRISFSSITQRPPEHLRKKSDTSEDLKRRSYNDELLHLDKRIWSDLEVEFRQTYEESDLGYENGDESDEIADIIRQLLTPQEEFGNEVRNPELERVETKYTDVKQEKAKYFIIEPQSKNINLKNKEKSPIKDQKPETLNEGYKGSNFAGQEKSKITAEAFKVEKQSTDSELKNAAAESEEETLGNIRYHLKNEETELIHLKEKAAKKHSWEKLEPQDSAERSRSKYTATVPHPDHLRENLDTKRLNESAESVYPVEKCEKHLYDRHYLKCLDGKQGTRNIKDTLPNSYISEKSKSIQAPDKAQDKPSAKKSGLEVSLHGFETICESNKQELSNIIPVEDVTRQSVTQGFFITHDKVGFIGQHVDQEFVSFEADRVTLYQPYENQMLIYDIANCVASQAYMKMSSLRFDIEYRKNAEQMSPSGKIPFISSGLCIIPEFEGIVSFMQYKKFSCIHMDECDKPSFRAMVSMVVDFLESSERYICWCEEHTLNNYTKPRVGGPYPFPLNHIMNLKKKYHERRVLEEHGITRKSLDMILAEINSCFRNLSQRLGSDDFFFGKISTELDALVYGHIYALFTTPLDGPFKEIRLILKCYPNLISFVENFDKKYALNKFISIETLINV